MLILTIGLLTFWFLVIIILLTFVWGGLLAAPWVPVRSRDVKRMLKLAEIAPGEILYDLGSGDGRLIIAAARDFKTKSVGFEVALLPFLIAWVKILVLGLKPKVTLKYKNFYEVNLSEADVITAFLSPRAMQKLKQKFAKELKPGCRVISYVFKIPDWPPVAVDKPSEKDLKIFVYQAPF